MKIYMNNIFNAIPVNNALTHNDFITAVQQRHGSY